MSGRNNLDKTRKDALKAKVKALEGENEQLSDRLGHADITSTQVYAQVTEQKISNDMDKLIAKRERNRLSNEKTIGK